MNLSAQLPWLKMIPWVAVYTTSRSCQFSIWCLSLPCIMLLTQLRRLSYPMNSWNMISHLEAWRWSRSKEMTSLSLLTLYLLQPRQDQMRVLFNLLLMRTLPMQASTEWFQLIRDSVWENLCLKIQNLLSLDNYSQHLLLVWLSLHSKKSTVKLSQLISFLLSITMLFQRLWRLLLLVLH